MCNIHMRHLFWSEINYRWGKNQGHRGHREIKCIFNQGLLRINLNAKFNLHSVFVLNTDAPHDVIRHPRKFGCDLTIYIADTGNNKPLD